MKIIQTLSFIKLSSDLKIHPNQPGTNPSGDISDQCRTLLENSPPNAPLGEDEIKQKWTKRKKRKTFIEPEEIPTLSI